MGSPISGDRRPAHPYLAHPTPLAIAHRGGNDPGAAENTMAAFQRAVDLGYRYLETDVRATRDGVPVVFHDSSLARMLGSSRQLEELTWADLATERIGGAAALPRLPELLAAWPNIHLNIDAKADSAVEPVIAAVDAAGAQSRVLLASFSARRLRRIRRACGSAQATSLGMGEVAQVWLRARTGLPIKVAPGVVAAQVPVRFGPVRVVNARFIARLHRLGLQVHVWTINDPAEMHELLDLGVDGIMTDHIELLRDVFVARGLWSTPDQ